MSMHDQTQPGVVVTTGNPYETANNFPDPSLEVATTVMVAASPEGQQLPQDQPTHKRKKARAEDWRTWSRFRLWRKQRPFWGSLFLMLAGIMVLGGPLSLFPMVMISGGTISEGLLVGTLLLVMGLLQLISPSHALVTGSIALVLSFASVLVALGGYGVGVFLGIIGSALGIAWRPAMSSSQHTAVSQYAGVLSRKQGSHGQGQQEQEVKASI
jgi:hypothetical protein